MRGSGRILALLAAVLVAAACADLDVTNTNDPDKERALSTPGDVETLISGTFRTWYLNWMEIGDSPAGTFSCMADQHTASWGNISMKDSCSESGFGRIWVINNDPAYGYSYVVEEPWYHAYTVLSSVRDGIISIAGEDGILDTDDDMQIGDGGEDNPRAIFFVRLMQGLAHMNLGLMYDKGFIFDEGVDPFEDEILPVPYDELADTAVAFLNMAIDIAEVNSFNIPSSWIALIPGKNNEDMVALCGRPRRGERRHYGRLDKPDRWQHLVL
jgi:hypothetical protein